MSFVPRVLLSYIFLNCFLLLVSQQARAIEFIDAVIPAKLKDSYDKRQIEPLSCIETTTKFIATIDALYYLPDDVLNTKVPYGKAKPKTISTQQLVLASCYTELEDYKQTLALLMPQLKENGTSNEIRALNLIANNIPELERPHLNNAVLIRMLTHSLKLIKHKKDFDSPNLINALNFSIAKLALDTHQYQLANQALTRAREEIKGTKETKLRAWLAYFYAHYYDQINQDELAISNYRIANSISDRLHLTRLSSLIKKSLSTLYQKKHRYTRAIHFASQRVELLLGTENYVQQADSLINFAVLKRQNKEYNQSLIYLYNSLDLVEKKNNALTAKAYFELGQTYLSIPEDLEKNAEFAQKFLQNARNRFQKMHKQKQETESILLLAKLNIRNKDTSLAILQLERVLLLANKRYPQLRVKAFEMLALSYELSGDHQQANFYFKSFHSLQNTIKEKLFTLQQLKINEQFQLIEQTQQKIQLETENNQLLLKNNLFKNIAYWVISLCFLTVSVIILILIRHKKVLKREQKTQREMQLHPRSKLRLHKAQIKNYELQYKGIPLFYALVHVPFLTDLNEIKGLFKGEKIELKLGQELKSYFFPEIRVSQVRDNQLLFISEQEHHGNAEQFSQKIETFFQTFADKYSLKGEISSGIVAFPFLNNVSKAISPERMLNLTSLALYGACQIREQIQQSSWLELYAIEKIQPAFFDGDLWLLGQAGIDKGIVKLKSSHPEITINWPSLKKR